MGDKVKIYILDAEYKQGANTFAGAMPLSYLSKVFTGRDELNEHISKHAFEKYKVYEFDATQIATYNCKDPVIR